MSSLALRVESVGPWIARLAGEEQLLTRLLGGRPISQVVIDGVPYVLPDGVDPYWERFRDVIGWQLLPEAEQPRPRGDQRMAPSRPRQLGWEEPERTTWPHRPRRALDNPRVSWRALGDLRRALRVASLDAPALIAPSPRLLLGDAHAELHAIERRAEDLAHRVSHVLFAPRRTTPQRPTQISRHLSLLKDATELYLYQHRSLMAALAEEHELARKQFADTLLTGAEIPACDRSARGAAPKGPLLFVHAASAIVATDDAASGGTGSAMSEELLASVDALEPEHAFRGPGILGGPRDRRAAMQYWRSELRQYRRAPKHPSRVADEAPLEPQRPAFMAATRSR